MDTIKHILVYLTQTTRNECKQTVRPVVNIDGSKPDVLPVTPFEYTLRPTLPWDALHSVKHCYIRLHWYTVMSSGREQDAWEDALTTGHVYRSN
ncbi:hypothetical protein LTR56_007304 [Elasticomyces elasticus]|nr:hypothetical protein LTR56_007304 [Elasticomyces elasticus]KAK4918918.1 hypothetical protein LTR49_013390 [Elasticomyces elasticus]KAK5753803.1 hypothetical protein LTS12_016112 [Elasticomyces elasticus]